MKNFFNENKILIIAACMPIIVIVFLMCSTLLPSYWVANPKYNLIFEKGFTDSRNGLTFNIVNSRLKIEYHTSSDNNNYKPTLPQLYIFDAATLTTREIIIPIPAVPTPPKNVVTTIEIKVPELESLNIVSTPQAPDGYQFNSAPNYTFLFNLFSKKISISKHGKYILLLPDLKELDYYNIKFIGWILSEKKS